MKHIKYSVITIYFTVLTVIAAIPILQHLHLNFGSGIITNNLITDFICCFGTNIIHSRVVNFFEKENPESWDKKIEKPHDILEF